MNVLHITSSKHHIIYIYIHLLDAKGFLQGFQHGIIIVAGPQIMSECKPNSVE